MGMQPSWRDVVLLQGIHLHKGGPTHAYWRLPCQACPQLSSAAFPRCNTLKPTHQYLFLTQKGPSSKHMFITLDSAARFGLGGCSDEPSRKGGSGVQDLPSTCRRHPSSHLLPIRIQEQSSPHWIAGPPKIQRTKQQKTTRGPYTPADPRKVWRENFQPVNQKIITNKTILPSSLPANQQHKLAACPAHIVDQWSCRCIHVTGDVVVSESHVTEVLKEGTDGSEDMSSEIIYCVWHFLRVFWAFRKKIFPITPQLSWNELNFSLYLLNKTKWISWLYTLSK